MSKRKMHRNWTKIYSIAIGCVIGLIIVVIAIALSGITLSSLNVLQSLIQAEATVLGFLGVVVTYLLTSYDTRLDRLEQQRFDTMKAHEDDKGSLWGKPYHGYIDKKIESIRLKKEDMAKTLGTNSFFLVASLILSIVALGMMNSNSPLLNFIGTLGLGFFFMGIFGIIVVFIQISQEA